MDIIIIGAGGVGREVALIIEQINARTPKWNILGIVDDNESMWGKVVNGYVVVPFLPLKYISFFLLKLKF